MTTEITRADDVLEIKKGLNAETITLLKQTVVPAIATNEQIAFFLAYCKAKGADPFKRELQMLVIDGRVSFHTGIDFLRKKADATGKLLSIKTVGIFSTDSGTTQECDFDLTEVNKNLRLVACKTIISKVVGERVGEFIATASLASYEKPSSKSWQQFKFLMLTKCSEALALRRAFPNELLGMYETTELDGIKSEKPREVIDLEMKKNTTNIQLPIQQTTEVVNKVESESIIQAPIVEQPTPIVKAVVQPVETEVRQQTNDYKITEKQERFLYVKAKQAGVTPNSLKMMAKTNYGKDHLRDLTKSELDKFLKELEEFQVKNGG